MKAKLVGKELIYAPRDLTYNNIKYVGGVPDEILQELGYKDVLPTDAPEPTEGYHPVSHWEESENYIALIWELVENSIPDKIAELKQKLLDTDYQAIKYAEGWITAQDYAYMKAQRQAWRDEINELENNLG